MNTQRLPRSPLGGISQRILVRAQFPGDDPRNTMPVPGAAGRYRVVITLKRPSADPTAEGQISLSETIEGDSHLAIAAPALRVPEGRPALQGIRLRALIDSRQFLADGIPNKRGFLSHFVLELEAKDFSDAETLAVRVVAPSLSAWSLHLDVPLIVWRVLVKELASEAVSGSFVNPHGECIASGFAAEAFTAEFRTVASFYREALESTGPVYQFLCLYKIAEALRDRRQQQVERAKREGKSARQPSERFPKDATGMVDWLRPLYPPTKTWSVEDVRELVPAVVYGRKINDLIASDLRSLRNDVAHGLWTEQGLGTLVADEALHIRRVHEALPVIRLIVRRMLKSDFPLEFKPHPAY